MINRFRDKVVLVTGGNSGIGRDSAIAFAGEGAQVVITGRDQATLDSAVAEIGHGATAIRADAGKVSEIDKVIDFVRQRHGRIDVLFVNAGVAFFADVEDVTEQAWDDLMNVNLKGFFFTIQKALPFMAPGSTIVMNSSIGHLKGFPFSTAYSASKAGVRSMARSLGLALAPRNIRINLVSPGPIDTPLPGRTPGAGDPEEAKKGMAATVPLGRMGEPREVTTAVLYLASDESSFITGQDLIIDGGITC